MRRGFNTDAHRREEHATSMRTCSTSMTATLGPAVVFLLLFTPMMRVVDAVMHTVHR